MNLPCPLTLLLRGLVCLLLTGTAALPCLATPDPHLLQVNDATAIVQISALPTAREVQPMPPLQWLSADFEPELYGDSLQPSPEVYWHRIQLQGHFSNSRPHHFHLVVGSHVLRHLQFFLFDNQQLLQQLDAGLLDRQKPDALFSGIHLDFELRDGQNLTLLIRKQNNGPAIMPLTLYSEPAFQRQQQFQYLFWGGVIAVLLALALYNALIYAMHPGSAYLWYLGFHMITFFYFSGLHGYGFLLWPEALQLWLAQNIMAMNFLLIWLVTRFAIVFLDAANNAPWHFRHYKKFTYVCWPGAVATLWLPEYAMIPPFSLIQVAGSLFGISMAYVALRNGYRPAIYFLTSWACTVIGAAVGMSTFMNILPVNFFTLHGFLLGALAELMLLSVALADRINFLEDQTLAKAFIDPQTQTPNFSFFKNKFPEQLDGLVQRHKHLHLLIIDLHGFRELVGLLGPDILDQAYSRHVERMTAMLMQKSWAVPIHTLQGESAFFISIPGGQEMLLVDAHTPHQDSMQRITQELLQVSEQAIIVADINSKISFRIGYAPFQQHQHSIFECFRQAQVALLTAQRNRRAVATYSSEQDAFIKQRLSLLSELRLAITQQELIIYIQPQIRINDRTLVGGEVLVRWIHAREGFISPSVFIPLAEQSQLIFEITRQVVAKSCEWLHNQSTLPEGFHLSVNLSALDINDNRLIPLIEHCLKAFNVRSSQILFEVTESAVMDDPERFLSVITQLHEMGFKVAIDDFGTGYSSMSYLQQMDADEIKIDMRFVRNIQHSSTNQNIVSAIVQLARSTRAYTVAEGIETAAELETLLALGCDVAQGYLWSAPIPAAVFAERFLDGTAIDIA